MSPWWSAFKRAGEWQGVLLLLLLVASPVGVDRLDLVWWEITR